MPEMRGVTVKIPADLHAEVKCPPLCSTRGGEKLVRLLADLHLPLGGEFSWVYSLFMRRSF